MQYTLDYFIEKFSAIPAEEWCMGTLTDGHGSHCAIGHCGGNSYYTVEAVMLQGLTNSYVRERLTIHNKRDKFKTIMFGGNDKSLITIVNDDTLSIVFPGEGPKERVLNLLNEIKEHTEGQPAVDQVNEILAEPRKEEALFTI